MTTTDKQTITTEAEAREYIYQLHADGLLYHFDDDAADCLGHHGLTAEQLEAIEHNVAQLFDVCPDPFIYALEAVNQ